MLRKLLSVVVVAAISGCASVPSQYTRFADVKLDGDTLYYSGSIESQPVLEAIRLAGNQAKTLVIKSGGGDVEAGIEFGYWVYDKGIDVVVDELCFSSCANYILTAAKSVVVNSGAVVGWHGGAFQDIDLHNRWYEYLIPNRTQNKAAYYDSMLSYLRKKETKFFDHINVDQKITTYGQSRADSCQKTDHTTGWFYRIPDLNKMGMREIRLADGSFAKYSEKWHVSACEMPLLFQ